MWKDWRIVRNADKLSIFKVESPRVFIQIHTGPTTNRLEHFEMTCVLLWLLNAVLLQWFVGPNSTLLRWFDFAQSMNKLCIYKVWVPNGFEQLWAERWYDRRGGGVINFPPAGIAHSSHVGTWNRWCNSEIRRYQPYGDGCIRLQKKRGKCDLMLISCWCCCEIFVRSAAKPQTV